MVNLTLNNGTLTVIKCPGCGRRDFRYRQKTRDYVCKTCGTVFEVYQDKSGARIKVKGH